MRQRRLAGIGFWCVQAVFVLAVGVSWALGSSGALPGVRPATTAKLGAVVIEREQPLRVTSLYNDPELVSDEDLAAVLSQVRPKFAPKDLKPNFVEHALRIWGQDATFRDPAVLSGLQLRDFLLDNSRYVASWGNEIDPLLLETETGVSVRWGSDKCASVHHDHWLACLAEAGVPRYEMIFTPSGKTKTINDALQQALRDFHVDEREVEWSALAFGLWLPPVREWETNDRRVVSFDLIARRLMRGGLKFGVCHGTHRLYSMMLLVRLDDEFHILSPEIREEIFAHLRHVRDLLIVSQFEDGHWSSAWQEGAKAVKQPAADLMYKKVISTGHHLEWLAIAPEELHPPRDQLRKAARWAIETTKAQTPEQIQQFYTFFSHVGGALSLWRSVRPSEFWHKWEETHPEAGQPTAKAEAAPEAKAEASPAAKTEAAKEPAAAK